MGRRFDKRVSITPDYLKEFNTGDIDKTFEVLEKYYRLHPDWRKAFADHYFKCSIGIPKTDEFFRWSTENLNRSLQVIRRDKDNVIFKVAKWVIREKIARIEEYERQKRISRANESEEVKLVRRLVLEEGQKKREEEKNKPQIVPKWRE